MQAYLLYMPDYIYIYIYIIFLNNLYIYTYINYHCVQGVLNYQLLHHYYELTDGKLETRKKTSYRTSKVNKMFYYFFVLLLFCFIVLLLSSFPFGFQYEACPV